MAETILDRMAVVSRSDDSTVSNSDRHIRAAMRRLTGGDGVDFEGIMRKKWYADA
jgi:hypothetical protein